MPDGRFASPDASVDEMVDRHGRLRPHWQGVLDGLGALDPAELARRAERLRRVGREEGSADAWRCDPVPLPLAAGEFALLEDGLRQRARLLEAVLADLYGPQATLAEGLLPPALAFANPGFLRACRIPAAPHPRFLHCYAADLVRGPDGAWRVLADRTGGALGIGWAREARRLLARVLPELFRGAQVRQLRPFFDLWHDALLAAAPPTPGRVPLSALLAPGADDPHWAEHQALSASLSCLLVEAGDLALHGGAAHLRTAEGLRPVDVLLRRVPGEALGPGLLAAAARGMVRVLNHPGAAAVEAPGLAAFLPGLCRRLLGESLRLSTVPTLWLADDGAQRTLVQGLNRWVVRPALDPEAPPTALGALPPEARAALAAAVAAQPWRFAACTAVTPSVAPCHGPGGLVPAPVVLRLFLVHDGGDWRMMQGGLARVLRPGEHVTQALPPGAVVKDVWVLAEDAAAIGGPGPVAAHQAAACRVPVRRGGGMPGRVADGLVRLAEHVERLGTLARLGRAVLLRCARGTPLPRELVEMEVLGRCLSAAGLTGVGGAGFAHGELGYAGPDGAIRAALLDGGSAARALDAAAGLVDALRGPLGTEACMLLTEAVRTARGEMLGGAVTGVPHGTMRDAPRGTMRDAPGGTMRDAPGGTMDGALGVDSLISAMAGLHRLATVLAGVAADGMAADGARRFLDLGRLLQRAHSTATILATVLDQPAARIDGALALVVELGDGAAAYRDRYPSLLQPAPVLDLVLADTGHPRALATQFAGLATVLAALGDAALAAEAAGLTARTSALADGVARAADPAAAAAALPPDLRALAAAAAALSEAVERRLLAPLAGRD